MGAPWLIGQIHAFLQGHTPMDNPTAKDRLSLALEHLNYLLETKGNHGLLIARKHLIWTCNGFPGAAEFRKSLVRANTPSKAIELLQEKIISLT